VDVNFSQLRQIRAADYADDAPTSEALLCFRATERIRLSWGAVKIVDVLKVEVARETATKAAIMNQCRAAVGGYEDESGTYGNRGRVIG
jgi:hypothetical protein